MFTSLAWLHTDGPRSASETAARGRRPKAAAEAPQPSGPAPSKPSRPGGDGDQPESSGGGAARKPAPKRRGRPPKKAQAVASEAPRRGRRGVFAAAVSGEFEDGSSAGGLGRESQQRATGQPLAGPGELAEAATGPSAGTAGSEGAAGGDGTEVDAELIADEVCIL